MRKDGNWTTDIPRVIRVTEEKVDDGSTHGLVVVEFDRKMQLSTPVANGNLNLTMLVPVGDIVVDEDGRVFKIKVDKANLATGAAVELKDFIFFDTEGTAVVKVKYTRDAGAAFSGIWTK